LSFRVPDQAHSRFRADQFSLQASEAMAVRVLNVHERSFRASPAEAARLLDSLSSSDDSLWPSKDWPRMRLDRPLGIGATGGHGPIRYSVTSYEPGKRVTFEFISPRGFIGTHWFEVLPRENSGAILRHTIEMSLVGSALITWPLVVRPLHDALVEDALTNAQVALHEQAAPVVWSAWVRVLRKAVGRRRVERRQ
jgi:hypothetical protein